MTPTITSRGARTLPEMNPIPEIHPPSVTPNACKKVPVNVDQGVVLEPGVVNGVSSPVIPGALSLSMAAPLSARFPLTCDSNIHLSLFGEVITCDLKTLGPDPALIIRLLKMTQSERANYMIVGASYRRSGFPQSAKAIMETMIQELAQRGVSESELKPAYLFLAGCESDLLKLSKASKNPAAASEHYSAARMWLLKVFEKADITKDLESSLEISRTMAPSDNINTLKHQIQRLHSQNTLQSKQLAEMRSSKRKIEDDYYYERNLRRKYQNRMQSVREKLM